MKSVICVLPYFRHERWKKIFKPVELEFQAILGSIKGTTGGGFTCYLKTYLLKKKRTLSSVQYPIEFFNSLIM